MEGRITKKDFHEREAAGTFRASRFVRDFAKKKGLISLELIYEIHKLILEDAWPEIAGKLRT